ncbi:MAG: DUF3800 domain-containing protein [Candidatus Methanomethylophilaceae archaeon]|nr:DUF3800 domain-containing protein [Candidatus Methanomethylophilaceae archaeon]
MSVDETGNPGKRTRGNTHYVLAGCAVTDRRMFERAISKYGSSKEIKFYENPNLRTKVILDALPAVDGVFYCAFNKRKGGWDGSGDKEQLHLDLLGALAEGIAKEYPGYSVEAVVDHNPISKDRTIERTVAYAFDKYDVSASVTVNDSSADYGLQTNDFFVGSIGEWLNRPRTSRFNPLRNVDLFADRLVECYRGVQRA